MSKKVSELKKKISDTIDKMDKIVDGGGKMRQNDPLMIKLVKLRRDLIIAANNSKK